MSAVDAASLGVSLAGVLAAALVLARARDPRTAILVLLDLWLAAGLLRLAGDPSWRRVVTAALVVLVRKLVVFGFTRAAAARRGR